MRICAIVLNYRDTARTEACLRSLMGQKVGVMLVVDNSDDTQAADELAAMSQRLRDNGADFDVQILSQETNLGFARGVNAALNTEQAQACDTVLLINNDAVAEPGMVKRLAATISNSTSPSAIAVPKIEKSDGLPEPALWYQRFFGLLTPYPLPGAFAFPSGCCLMLGKEWLKAEKLFDEDFFMYGEDILLGWQLTRAGVFPDRALDAIVHHTGGASSRKYGLFYEYHTARMHVLLALKARDALLEVPFLLVTKGVTLGARALWRCLRSRRTTPLLAFLLAWLPLNIRPDHGKQPN